LKSFDHGPKKWKIRLKLDGPDEGRKSAQVLRRPAKLTKQSAAVFTAFRLPMAFSCDLIYVVWPGNRRKRGFKLRRISGEPTQTYFWSDRSEWGLI
jgi:hypothetical protein